MHSTFLLNHAQTQLEQWLTPYLNLTWWMGHPFLSTITVLILLIIAQAVLGLFSYLIKQLLLWLVKSPYLIFQWLLSRASFNLKLPLPKRFTSKQPTKTITDSSHDAYQQLSIILQQLEATKQTQDQLLSELKQILATYQNIDLSLAALTKEATINLEPKVKTQPQSAQKG